VGLETLDHEIHYSPCLFRHRQVVGQVGCSGTVKLSDRIGIRGDAFS
jgi:hypothetical protein